MKVGIVVALEECGYVDSVRYKLDLFETREDVVSFVEGVVKSGECVLEKFIACAENGTVNSFVNDDGKVDIVPTLLNYLGCFGTCKVKLYLSFGDSYYIDTIDFNALSVKLETVFVRSVFEQPELFAV